MTILWQFEKPANLTALEPNNMTWTPTTFGSSKAGDFRLNMWLLRVDNPSDTVVTKYAPVLLFHTSVFNNSILWTPSANDIDTAVTHYGNHQMAWEKTVNNPLFNASNTSFTGFSTGFSIAAPAGFDFDLLSSSSSSVASTATFSSVGSPSTTANAATTAPASTSSSSTILGLSVAFSILAGILICIASIWAWRHFRKRNGERGMMELQETPKNEPPQTYSRQDYQKPFNSEAFVPAHHNGYPASFNPQNGPREMDGVSSPVEMSADSGSFKRYQ